MNDQKWEWPWPPEIVAAIKRTCAPGGRIPPDAEFMIFLHYCKKTGLDPLIKEVQLSPKRAKDQNGNWFETWQITVLRDGYLAAAHRSGCLSGMETIVYPEDVSQPPTHATCRVWRKDWPNPVTITVPFIEYVQMDRDGKLPQSMWRNAPFGKPRTMIGKVAESQALRRAFGLHGSYAEEELPQSEDQVVVSQASPLAADRSADLTPTATPDPPRLPVLEAAKAELERFYGAKQLKEVGPDPSILVVDDQPRSFAEKVEQKKKERQLGTGRSPEEMSKLLMAAIRERDKHMLDAGPLGEDAGPLGEEEPKKEHDFEPADRANVIEEIFTQITRIVPKGNGPRSGKICDLMFECFGFQPRTEDLKHLTSTLDVMKLDTLLDGLEKMRGMEVQT